MNSDGAALLTRQNDSLSFDNNGALSTVTDAQGRAFTVASTSAAGHTLLSSVGTASGQRANFSYTGDPLVRELDDPSSGHHYYSFTTGRLSTYSDPNGSTTYGYDANGYLNQITRPGGVSVAITLDGSGHVTSCTISQAGMADQVTSFSYAPGQTTVTASDGTTVYSYDSDGLVTGVNQPNQTVGGYQCQPAPSDSATDVQLPAPMDNVQVNREVVCPPNQVPAPVPYSGPKGHAAASAPMTKGSDCVPTPNTDPGAVIYCHAGYATTGEAIHKQADKNDPLTALAGTSAAMAQPQPQLGLADPLHPELGPDPQGHSLAEIIASDSTNSNFVELGWIADPVRHGGDATPKLFVTYWHDGIFSGYNPSQFVQVSTTLHPDQSVVVTDTPQAYAIVHDDRLHRWSVFYENELLGYFPDSLWGGSFTHAVQLQWFGELSTATAIPQPTTTMGNGLIGSCAGASKIDNITAFINTNTDYLPGSIGTNNADQTRYTVSAPGNRSFRFGGPNTTC